VAPQLAVPLFRRWLSHGNMVLMMRARSPAMMGATIMPPTSVWPPVLEEPSLRPRWSGRMASSIPIVGKGRTGMGGQSLWALRLALGTHGYSQTLPVPFCHPGGMTGDNADREGHQEPASAWRTCSNKGPLSLATAGASVSGDVSRTLTTVELRDGLGVSQFGIRKRSRRWVGKRIQLQVNSGPWNSSSSRSNSNNCMLGGAYACAWGATGHM